MSNLSSPNLAKKTSLETEASEANVKKVPPPPSKPVVVLTKKAIIIKAVAASIAFTVWMTLYIVGATQNEPQNKAMIRCAGLMAYATIMWATEAIPLWVTSMSIPLLAVVSRVFLKHHGEAPNKTYTEMPYKTAATEALYYLAKDNVIMLMGGLSIAAALHNYELDSRLASLVLTRAPGIQKPKIFILIIMVLCYVLSMFVNNIATPVLMLFLVTPVLHKLDDRKFCKCVVMSIAFACNVGGMPTPIASPQNGAALDAANNVLTKEGEGELGFPEWMAYSVPVSIPMLFASWLIMWYYWKPVITELPSMKSMLVVPEGNLSKKHYYVIGVTAVTVLLWILVSFPFMKEVFGNIGIVSLVPIVALYGARVLSLDDLKKLDWGVLLLLGGGACLGEAVKSSTLLDFVSEELGNLFGGLNRWGKFMAFNVLMLVLANFVSHTVAALTMIPIISSVGYTMGKASLCKSLVMGTVIMDSAASMLPVSSFPNVLAYGVRDENGQQYLTSKDYFLPSMATELASLIVISSLGYAMTNIFIKDF